MSGFILRWYFLLWHVAFQCLFYLFFCIFCPISQKCIFWVTFYCLIPERIYLTAAIFIAKCWMFIVDPDSIPVCGFQWNHWSLANLPVDALMYDFNDSHALAIPADFSRTVSAMIPETVQGRTSAASPLLKGRSSDPAVTMRYNGPYPPDQDHDYYLHVWGTTAPLNGLNQGFWLNEMERALRNSGAIADQGAIFLTGKA